MPTLNFPAKKPPATGGIWRWNLLDMTTAFFFGAVILFFFLVFTHLGDPLAAAGRQALLRGSTSDPKHRMKLIHAVENGAGNTTETVVDACPAVEYVDYMPCEDPKRSTHLSREMNFYRERQCPRPGESLLCLIPPPEGYRIPVHWPESLHKIWHANMPYSKIADRKGHQGWMKKEGKYFIFPGGGTMFPGGADQYVQKLGQYIPLTGGVLRTALDMGCGVASFGGYLLSENILTLSFAPRDSHKAQIQFVLERGIPAFVAMLGTRRLPFPAFSFDLVHCSRCLIPYTGYNASYFIEVDRLLRPGGYLVISGPPVKWAKQEKEWADLQAVAKALCFELITVDGNTAIWKKPSDNACLPNQNEFGLNLCDESDDPSYAWYFKLKTCVTRTSSVKADIGVGSIPTWPERLTKAPSRVAKIEKGLDVFEDDTRKWMRTVAYYKNSLNLKLGTSAVRNVMDMNAFFGGFATALISDPVWVMNVVPPTKPSTLDVIYDRGLIGLYHDWCEPFSTYPRTYDFLHVSGVESLLEDSATGEKRCNLVDLMVEMDRILRPEGTVVVRESPEFLEKVQRVAHAVRWTTSIHDPEPDSKTTDKIMVATKTFYHMKFHEFVV